MKKARRVLLTMVIALGMTVTAFAEENVLAKEFFFIIYFYA